MVEGIIHESSAVEWLHVGNRIGLPKEISQMILHKLTIIDDPPGWRTKVISKLHNIERKTGFFQPLIVLTLVFASTLVHVNDIIKNSTSYIDMAIGMANIIFTFVVMFVVILFYDK